jgi:hypothetical protein
MSDEQRQRIEARIAGRKMGTELFGLIEGDTSSDPYMESLIDEIRRLSGIRHAEPEVEKHEPIARLGATEMPFGAHAGKCFDDTPLEYLDWLCRNQEDFYKTLRAYLRHPELESRRAAEIGEPI